MSEAITRLEEKIAYLERHVVEQDRAMLELSDELHDMRRELKLLTSRLADREPSGPAENDPSDERPPHY